jgi:hypothetical protein
MVGFKSITSSLAAAVTLVLQGCYTYPAYTPVPVTSSVPASFDASWQAARGAASDEGVQVNYEDRASGTIRGTKGPVSVLITVATQPNGSVLVGFSVAGTPSQDTGLQDALTRAYQRRMGR